MTERVIIRIKGLQFDSSEESVEVINIGNMSEMNGKLCVIYDEINEGDRIPTKNLIKIGTDSVEFSKKGPVNASMTFKEKERMITFYETEYGNIRVVMFPSKLEISRSTDKVTVEMDYSLEINYAHVSDCRVFISIESKQDPAEPEELAERYRKSKGDTSND